MKRRLLFLVSLIFLCFSAVAQENQDFVTVCGEVVDAKTSDPLFFASISVENSRISNVSNSEGVFTVKVPAFFSDGSIIISHLGYASKSIKVSSFKGSTPQKPLRISLIPVSVQLEEAVIRSIDPLTLFRKVFSSIRENYPQEHVWMTAFYREMIRKGSGKYLSLSEAIIDIDKSPYIPYNTDKAAIYKGRGNQNYSASDSLIVKFQGGVHSALQLDFVKEPFAGVDEKDAEMYYNFRMGEAEMIDGKTFVVLLFDQKEDAYDILYHGKMYVDPESFAVARVEFSVNVEGREERASDIFILKKPKDTKFYINGVDYVMNYKEYDGKWYYEYSRIDMKFSTRRKNTLWRSSYNVVTEMAVTNHNEGEIRIIPNERVKLKDIMSERVSDFTDDNFWGNYNVIEPDRSIDNIVKIIVRQLRTRQK